VPDGIIMSTTSRLVIVGVLALAVGVAVGLRRKDAASSPPPSSASAASTPVGLPRLVDVGADKCIPCKAMAPILEELRQEYAGRLRVDFIDAWKYPAQAAPFDVYGIPTQIFFDPAGRELYRHTGFISKEDILDTWRRLGVRLTPGAKS
jgi:thioredoxin 1